MPREVLIKALADEGFEKVNKVPGELSKLLWSKGQLDGRGVQDDASMHMVRFAKGTGIPVRHAHASTYTRGKTSACDGRQQIAHAVRALCFSTSSTWPSSRIRRSA